MHFKAEFTREQLDFSPVPLSRVEEARRTRGGAASRPYLAELFYGFNLKSPKFADSRFREAIVHAIDREAIVKKVYKNTVRPSIGVVPQGTPGFVPDVCGDALSGVSDDNVTPPATVIVYGRSLYAS